MIGHIWRDKWDNGWKGNNWNKRDNNSSLCIRCRQCILWSGWGRGERVSYMRVDWWFSRGWNKTLLNCLRARFRRLLWFLLVPKIFMDQIWIFENRWGIWVRIWPGVPSSLFRSQLLNLFLVFLRIFLELFKGLFKFLEPLSRNGQQLKNTLWSPAESPIMLSLKLFPLTPKGIRLR